MEDKEYKINDNVKIISVEKLVEDYIKSKVFSSLDIEHLILLCKLSENKKYKVVDICISCGMLKIDFENKWLPIKFKHLY